MNHKPKLRLGTRKSPLAMAQAHEARSRLCRAHGWDEEAVELVPVLASGDQITDRPLAELGGKALWTKELDLWLHEGRIDGAVHSMKDVETLRPGTLTIAAILPREDVADRLIGAASLVEIPKGARLGTSAPRRAAQMLSLRPDIQIVGLRGNVATRLQKLEAGEADVTLLAAAGLARLGEAELGVRLDPEEWLPAPAQGAIGIECRTGDDEARAILGAINHGPSYQMVMAERAFLEGLGGTCHSPIGVYSRLAEGEITLSAALYSADGALKQAGEICADAGDLPAFRTFAAGLLARAHGDICKLFDGA